MIYKAGEYIPAGPPNRKNEMIEPADGLPVMTENELDAMSDTLKIDAFRPAYKQKCENCGQSPTVKGVLNNRIAYNGTMCGPCTWGESEASDPETWNGATE